MNLEAIRTHDILGANSTNKQRIGDKRAMTEPRHRFGAHQRDPILTRQLDQFFEGFLKIRRLHVIRVATKRGISPAHVDGIAFRITQTAEFRHMNVSQASLL